MFNSARAVAHIVPVALFAVVMLSPGEFVRAAAPDGEAPSVTLQYRGTDLDTPKGVSVLYRRIRSAASSVCGAYDNALLEEKVLWNECVQVPASAGSGARRALIPRSRFRAATEDAKALQADRESDVRKSVRHTVG